MSTYYHTLGSGYSSMSAYYLMDLDMDMDMDLDMAPCPHIIAHMEIWFHGYGSMSTLFTQIWISFHILSHLDMI